MRSQSPQLILFADWEIIFDGDDQVDCRKFVATINRHAFTSGKAKDDQWIAEFAGACFAEDALVWYVGLEDETRDSRKLLRKAILTEYAPSLTEIWSVER